MSRPVRQPCLPFQPPGRYGAFRSIGAPVAVPAPFGVAKTTRLCSTASPGRCLLSAVTKARAWPQARYAINEGGDMVTAALKRSLDRPPCDPPKEAACTQRAVSLRCVEGARQAGASRHVLTGWRKRAGRSQVASVAKLWSRATRSPTFGWGQGRTRIGPCVPRATAILERRFCQVQTAGLLRAFRAAGWSGAPPVRARFASNGSNLPAATCH